MRKCLQAVLLMLAFEATLAIEFDSRDRADDAMDDGFFPGIICHDCRDPAEYPADYAAIIYNGFFGDNPWLLGWKLGLPLRIYSAELGYVVIWFEAALFDAPSLLPNLLNIRIRLPNGVILTLTVLQQGPDMLVGEQDNSAPGDTPSTGEGGGGGGEDYEEPEEFEEIEFDDPIGHVEIIDPDEDGEFPEWEEEA